MAENKEIAIGELSRRTGVNIETIRYYERIGVVRPPSRLGRYRRYGTDDQKRLVFVRRSRDLGFSLDEVRALLRLTDNQSRSCGKVRNLANNHLDGIQRKLVELRRMERVLKNMIAQCAGGTLPECPLLDALFGESK